MLQDNKLASHGKQVTNDNRSQIPSLNPQAQQHQQGAASHLGPKYTGGGHGVKASQISPCNPGLKAASQSASGIGPMLKTKSKRERTVAADDAESRNAVPPSLDADTKGESVMRSKRRCVLEKKQPYSGDEWCSGPDTEDEDKPHTTIIRERGLGGAIQGPSAGTMSEVRGPFVGCGIGSGLKAELPHNQQQVVYVFTTSLANSAAEAVVKGQTDSILLFHQQNVVVNKLSQGHSSGKLPNLSEKMSSSPATGTTKTQSVTPQPASTGAGGILHPVSAPSSAGHSDSEPTQIRLSGVSSNNHISTHVVEGGSVAPCPGNGSGDGGMGLNLPVASPSSNPSILSSHYQSETGPRSGPENSDCLSKEQLEHRERSLQTLRDIERLFLRTGAGGCPRDAGDPSDNPSDSSSNPSNNYNNNGSGVHDSSDNGTTNSRNCGNGQMLSSALASMEGMKRYEEPLQSMLSQTQSLVGPPLDNSEIDSHNNLPHLSHHQLASPGVDMVPFPGPEGLTPEQIAWRKLQEEYYLEKRRQQELQPRVHPQHFRMMPEMGMPGGPMMVRGPPPPYHSKPGGQPWGPVNIMGGGLGGNARIMEMHQDGPRGPRFLGPIQRGPPGGGGFPNSAGDLLSVRGQRPQMPPRPGMIWLDDVPNNLGGGGRFHGIYPSGPAQHLQSDTEHLLTQEEVFRIMQKRQRLPRFELERLIKLQQQGNIGSRLLDNPGGLDFPNVGMGQCPPALNIDSMEFPVPQELMHSPGGGPQRRDFADSSLRNNLIMSMNPQINTQQQQQVMLSQKLLGGPIGERPLDEMLSPGEIPQIRPSQNGRGGTKMMMQGPDSSLQFPNQGPFSGEQMVGPYLQQPGPGLFGADQQSPEQISATSRLSHMSMPDGLRGTDLSPRQPPDLSTNVDTINTSSVPSHQLKSPSINQEPSPLLPSPSAPGLNSPNQVSAGHHPPLPPASGAGTPSSSSMKSPQVLGSSNLVLHSPSASPRQLKSPAITAAVSSPGWVSPKTTLSSPGGPPNSRLAGSGVHSSTETGQSLPPRSSNSTSINQQGTMNPTLPFTSSSKVVPSQNPLSLIMSQMSKYAMPSATPLYHDAIKTIATSDDEMLPDRPLLAGVSVEGAMGNSPASHVLVSQSSIGGHSGPQSPMCVVSQSQPHLSHEVSRSMLPSPNHMGMPTMNAPVMGGGTPDRMGPCSASPIAQSQMTGFASIQQQTHDSLHSPVGGMSQNFSQLNDEGIPPQRLHLLGKGHPLQCPTHSSDSFTSMPMDDGPDLSEVIRPTRTGIPEFDLSRIIPSDKPSSTLQYFPKSDQHQNPHPGPQQNTPQQLLKQLSSASSSHSSGPSSNPHLANLQNMMAEQQLQSYPSHAHQSMASRNMVSSGGMGSMDHMMGRTGMVSQQQLQQQQAMMANSHHHPPNAYPGMMPSQQHPHNLMVQQNIMMMQAKQRAMSVPGDPFGPQGPLMSAQGPMMAPSQSQSGVIGPQSMRQRGMSMESPIGYGPGRMANMPF